MESGHIEAESVSGPVDLQTTLESGQTFLWRRVETGDGTWFRTVAGADVIEVRADAGGITWRSSTDAAGIVRRRLGLDDDLPAIQSAFPDHPVLEAATARYPGLRVVDAPVVPTIFSFILSAQMRVDRIHENVTALRAAYGEPIAWRDTTVHAFPTPSALAGAGEAELRDLGLGYRAPYIEATAEMLRDDEVSLDEITASSYEEARAALTQFVGVGPKVADCVLLFAMDFDEPVPLDTWINTAIEEHFPDAAGDSYESTSRAIRDRLGPNPGYAQTYLFTHLRTGGDQ
ncbi:MAG: DNA-3-methyladenine glycosylase family protein [Halobacteriota archaeon]